MEIEVLMKEIRGYIQRLDISKEGEHLWDNYQECIAIMLRVSSIRTEIAYLEVMGTATPQEKKFRTMILDPLIDRLHEVATFESRKITAKSIEAQMEK